MTKSLDNELPGDETWEADPYANKHGYRSTPSMIRVLTRSQEAEVLEVSEVSL